MTIPRELACGIGGWCRQAPQVGMEERSIRVITGSRRKDGFQSPICGEPLFGEPAPSAMSCHAPHGRGPGEVLSERLAWMASRSFVRPTVATRTRNGVRVVQVLRAHRGG